MTVILSLKNHIQTTPETCPCNLNPFQLILGPSIYLKHETNYCLGTSFHTVTCIPWGCFQWNLVNFLGLKVLSQALQKLSREYENGMEWNLMTYIDDSYLSMPLEIIFWYLRLRIRVWFLSYFLHNEIVNFSNGFRSSHNKANTLCCTWKDITKNPG